MFEAHKPSGQKQWYVYMVRCSDDTLYTGMTNNLYQRLARHNVGIGSKYTRSRLPVALIWYRRVSDKSEALRLERVIKKMSRSDKMALIEMKG